MNERFISAYEETLTANKSGEVKNLLIADGDSLFLDEAQYALRRWVLDKGFNLVEIDEAACDWLEDIQSRELFGRLNEPNTVLLVKNYATEKWCSPDGNTPRNFLRDAALNRHYGCGNDFFPADELPNLLFMVALNPVCCMYWDKKERESFAFLRVGATEAKIEQILRELGMAPESHRDFGWLKEIILMAVRDPDTWEAQYAEEIGKREGITRERVRQILHKAVWNHWTQESGRVIEKHFGADVPMNFEYVKPNHLEFVKLLASALCDRKFEG